MVKRILNKKGSHIEMVLSFIVFVTFLVFLYAIIAPSIRKQSDKDYLLEYLEENIIKESSSDLDYYSLTLTNKPTSNCFVVDDGDFPSSLNIIVKNASSNDKINAQIYRSGDTGDSNNGDIVIKPENKEKEFRIYYSDKFAQIISLVDTACPILEKGTDYYFNFIRRENLVYSADFANNLKCSTSNNEYSALKDKFNIPDGREFAFEFGEVLSYSCNIEAKNNAKTNIYSDEIPVLYFDDNANINTGSLTVYVW